MCTACARHMHGMCTACARHVKCVGVCCTPSLSDNSCWDRGNPLRAGFVRDHGREAVYAGCPPFSPPLPSPPPSPPHSDRQRRLRSDGGGSTTGRYPSRRRLDKVHYMEFCVHCLVQLPTLPLHTRSHSLFCIRSQGWSWHSCHQHWHYDNYAHYALRNLCTDDTVAWEDRPVVGHKNGWCVARPRPRPDRNQTQTKVRVRIWPRLDPDPRAILSCRCISAPCYTPL